MQYTMEERPPAWVIRFDGDMSGEDDPELRKLFVKLSTEGRTQVVADMSQVAFMDSTVLGTIVWGMKNLREIGGDFRMCGLTEFVQNLFAITHLDRAFEVFPSEVEAAQSYA